MDFIYKQDLLANYIFLIFRVSFGNSGKYSLIQTSTYKDCERRNYTKIKIQVWLQEYVLKNMQLWKFSQYFPTRQTEALKL